MAYTFYLKEMKLPVPPESLELQIGNQNKTVTLINEGEVNILKTPGLTNVSFSFLIPSRARSFTQDLQEHDYYLGYIEDLKVQAEPFQFIVYRETLGGDPLFDTNLSVSLEDYRIKESADNLTDLIIEVNLKQWRDYGTKILEVKNKADGKTTAKKKPASTKKPAPKSKSYTVKSGDTLWALGKKFYGDNSKWTKIYNANKSVIESTARKHGFKSSSNGRWIFPGCKLTIPA